MNASQLARMALINKLVAETLAALDESVICTETLDDLLCMEPVGSIEHAAYAIAFALIESQGE